MTDFIHSFSSLGSLNKPMPFLKVDPVLTEAISKEEGERFYFWIFE